jgi:hypothetical protein
MKILLTSSGLRNASIHVEVVPEGHWKLSNPARQQASRLGRHARSPAPVFTNDA